MPRFLPLLLLLTLLGGCKAGSLPALPGAVPDKQPATITTPKPIKPSTATGDFKEISMDGLDQRTMVIMYHDVIAERVKGSEWFDITVDELREQLDFVQASGGHFITLDELYDHLVSGHPLPERAVVVTFDDNYQGVADLAVPLLEARDVPYAVFVHTNYVGSQQGHPKMTWDTLKSLIATGKLTVGSHTASHPNDITALTDRQQQDEMEKSQEAIFKALGSKTPYIAWANGKYNDVTKRDAEDAGYRMAFTMDSGAAEGSAGMLEIKRYPWNKFYDGWYSREAEYETGYSPTKIDLSDQPVEKQDLILGRIEYVALIGGQPVSYLSDKRQEVGEFVAQAGAVGGINGGFFAMAAVASDDNKMLGPVKTANRADLVASYPVPDPEKLRNRPLLLWNKQHMTVVPYQPERMNDDKVLSQILPDYQNCFLAGAWLVINGTPLNKVQILQHGASDAQDPRRRVFIGFRADGVIVCGASLTSVTSVMLAEAAATLGCQDAFLLDSGFSTSLILGKEVIASGHSTKDKPSRPVPHAIVLMGTLAKNQPKIMTGTQSAQIDPEAPRSHRRRRR